MFSITSAHRPVRTRYIKPECQTLLVFLCLAVCYMYPASQVPTDLCWWAGFCLWAKIYSFLKTFLYPDVIIFFFINIVLTHIFHLYFDPWRIENWTLTCLLQKPNFLIYTKTLPRRSWSYCSYVLYNNWLLYRLVWQDERELWYWQKRWKKYK